MALVRSTVDTGALEAVVEAISVVSQLPLHTPSSVQKFYRRMGGAGKVHSTNTAFRPDSPIHKALRRPFARISCELAAEKALAPDARPPSRIRSRQRPSQPSASRACEDPLSRMCQ